MEFRFFPGRKCWEVKVCMTFDANQWVWYYISLKFPLPGTIFFPKLSKALSPSALLSFEACTCFYVTRFQRWRMHVFHFRPTLNFMWETDEERVMSRTQDYSSCGGDAARYLRVGRSRMTLCSQCGLDGSGVAFARILTWPASLPRPQRWWTAAAAALRVQELLIACVGLLKHLVFLNVLLVTAWVRWEVSEPRRNILCDLVFKPTPSEEDLRVTRSWALMSSIILFISYAACKWNHWQVLFINDEAITRKMGAHTEGHNIFQ